MGCIDGTTVIKNAPARDVSGCSTFLGSLFLTPCCADCLCDLLVVCRCDHAPFSWLRLPQAEKLMEDMLEAGLAPNVVTYTSLMVVLRKGGQYEKSIGMLGLMRSKVMWAALLFCWHQVNDSA